MARVWAALGTVYVLWGSTYLAIMVAIRTLPPLFTSSARFLLAGAVLFLWAVHKGHRPDARQWVASAVSGAALLFVGTGGITWAETRVDSGLAALVVAVVPIWVALLEWLVFRRRPARAALVGLAVGLAAVGVLVGPGGSMDLVGGAALVLASLVWAGGSLFAQRAPLPADPFLSSGMQMLSAGVLLGVAGVFAGEPAHVGVPSAASLAALLYLVVAGSIVAFTAFAWLLTRASATLVSTHAYVNPVVAVALGSLVLGERLSLVTILAGGAIVASVVLIVTAAPRRAPAVLAEPELPGEPALERAA